MAELDNQNLEELNKLSRDPLEQIYSQFITQAGGLTDSQVAVNRKKYGFNELKLNNEKSLILLFLSKFYNPLVITLLIVATLSFFFGQQVSASIIIAMALSSAIITFFQEHSASQNAKKLREMVKINVTVLRNKEIQEISLREIVPGDIVKLSAGKMIPADVRILSSKDLYINQSTLNGESFPMRKNDQSDGSATDSIFNLQNMAFMGSSVTSGLADVLVLKTGANTEFGKLSKQITTVNLETGFDKGIKQFTWMMIRLILILTVIIFLSNTLLKGNPIEALLFTLAVAVGLTPEMLPMIVTVNLSKGAIKMARQKVIVKELDSIQNLGAMDILCTDKTGTLTLDNISLVRYMNIDKEEDENIVKLAYYNSFFQTGMENLLDNAVVNFKKFTTQNLEKIDEIPYDFSRRLMSVIISENNERKIIVKGAPEEIFKRTKLIRIGNQDKDATKDDFAKLTKDYNDLSQEGFRVLAVAYKNVDTKEHYDVKEESELIFVGFIAFLDPPKPDAIMAIQDLQKLGIKLKVLSGDNELVTEKICKEVKIDVNGVLSGKDIDRLNDDELRNKVEEINVFSRLAPFQKQRIVKALQQNSHIVGYLGDGINDSPSIKQADVGISVNNGADIAKETADIILLEKNLDVLADCVKEGRRTFANVIKYIKMGASSNFGNMLSMTGASLFLPFLPMLPTQILLNNFLYDISQTAIPTDNVDPEYLMKPRPWNVNFIKEFIIYLGPISSIFDFATFGIMLYLFKASPELFRSGWFVESLCTQVLVIYIIRTNKVPFFESSPSRVLFISTIAIVLIGAIIPYTRLGHLLGFAPLPLGFFAVLLLLVAVYLTMVQFVKNWFVKKFGYN